MNGDYKIQEDESGEIVLVWCKYCSSDKPPEEFNMNRVLYKSEYLCNECRSTRAGYKYTSKHPSPPRETICAGCGNTFTYTLHQGGNHKYCSIECYQKYRITTATPIQRRAIYINRICENCNLEFEVREKELKLRAAKYCSIQCLGMTKRGEDNPQWRGGTGQWHRDMYGSNWKERRRATVIRDDYTCRLCRIRLLYPTPDVHHIIPIRLSDDKISANVMSNLISLCHDCHMIAETLSFPNTDELREKSITSETFIGWLNDKRGEQEKVGLEVIEKLKEVKQKTLSSFDGQEEKEVTHGTKGLEKDVAKSEEGGPTNPQRDSDSEEEEVEFF